MSRGLFLGISIVALAASMSISHLDAVTPAPTVVNCESLSADWPAKRAAETWLNLVDRQDYVQSWVAASSFVKCYHTHSQWACHLSLIRCGFGQPETRILCDCSHLCNPCGFPKGDYYWLEYQTCFNCYGYVKEIVMVHCECDRAANSRWRVVHYHLQELECNCSNG